MPSARRIASLLIACLVLLAPTAGGAAAPAAAADTSASSSATKPATKKKPRKSKKQIACERRAKRIKKASKRRAAIKRCAPKKKKKKAPKPPALVPPKPPAPVSEGGIGDATVIAVLDFGTNPYHLDFRSSTMPQHLDSDRGNDLPLDRPFTEWLTGAEGAATPIRTDISLPADPEETSDSLNDGDDKKLTKLRPSTADKVNVHWIPGTKVIGAASFADDGAIYRGVDSHGVGTTSSSVGNLHGTCPECLLFFVELGDSAEESEAAIDWVMKQPWIDAISNSYGYSLTGFDRTRFYDGSNTKLQAQASERGQTVFFSAGNGNDGAFLTPNQTTFSSQEGPDWIVTVGAVSPPGGSFYSPDSGEDEESASYTGAGKPADVAGIGDGYPTAYTAASIGGTGGSGFGGTSNATPQVAGLFGRALYLARTALPGPSRAQGAGVVASGSPVACGPVRPDCELADGKLTATELRHRLFYGAVHTSAGFGVYTAGAGPTPSAPPVGEEEFLNEGHGSYMGRVSADRKAWLAEFDRMYGPITGTAKAFERPAGEAEWMIVDSYCRQKNWGSWTQGFYVEGKTPLPGPDPQYPVRTQREQTCPGGPT